MHEPIKPPIDRTITSAEVLGWFTRGRKPSEECCDEIAARLNKMQWPGDPRLPLPESSSPDPWWHAETAAATARALLDDIPAMKWFWRSMRETKSETMPGQSPERLREGYDAIDQLRVALKRALPYIEFPFGKYQHRDHRKQKRPKNWHAHAVAITPIVAAALKQTGHEVRGTSHNTALVRIVREALLRIGHREGITVDAVADYLTRWYGEHDRKMGR
jgi:hypothetical protein